MGIGGLAARVRTCLAKSRDCGVGIGANLAAMRVLIVRLGAFGDIVHTVPLAADLAAAGHAVGWLCESRWACLVSGSPAVHRVHAYTRADLARGSLATRLRLLRRLRAELRGCYDAVIDAQGLLKSAFLSCISGAEVRVAAARPRAREGTWILPARRVPATAVHVVDQQRALALGLGVRPSGGWRFPMPAWQAERVAAATWLAERGLRRPWMLNVGAGWPTKIWPAQRQAALVSALRDRGTPVVALWGSPAEQAAAQALAAAGAVVAPQTTIPASAGLLAAAGVVISGDTGPLHLAHALGSPVVGLFGPVPATRNGPRGPTARTIQGPGAPWERRDVARSGMDAISVEAVLAAGDAVAVH
jgi:heptosyltransferase I